MENERAVRYGRYSPDEFKKVHLEKSRELNNKEARQEAQRLFDRTKEVFFPSNITATRAEITLPDSNNIDWTVTVNLKGFKGPVAYLHRLSKNGTLLESLSVYPNDELTKIQYFHCDNPEESKVSMRNETLAVSLYEEKLEELIKVNTPMA